MRITGLPFPFDIYGNVSSGGAATLRIELAPDYTDPGFDQLRCVVAWFAELAELGALGGEVMTPAAVRATLVTPEPDQRWARPAWHFVSLAIAPAAAIHLANLVYGTGLTVRSACIDAPGLTDPATLACDAYPGRYGQLPFRIHEDLIARQVDISLDFGGDLADSLHGKVCDAMQLWAMVTALGGCRLPVPLDERLDALPETAPEITLDQLTFSVRDQGLHAGAYDLLVNLCAGLAVRGIPISALTLA